MQLLEVSGAVRHIYESLVVKRLIIHIKLTLVDTQCRIKAGGTLKELSKKLRANSS